MTLRFLGNPAFIFPASIRLEHSISAQDDARYPHICIRDTEWPHQHIMISLRGKDADAVVEACNAFNAVIEAHEDKLKAAIKPRRYAPPHG